MSSDLSLVPLVNFDSEVKIVRFNNDVILRPIDDAELQRIKKTFPPFQSFLMRALSNVKYGLEMKAEMIVKGQRIAPIYDTNLPNVTNTILALRLLKAGKVSPSCAVLLKQNQVASLSQSSQSFFPSDNPYYLKKEEIPELKEIWKKIINIENEKPDLRFPLFRFNKTFDGIDTNPILEHMITFESLVFHGEKKSIEPAGNVIGIAIGMLIGKNQQERDTVKKSLIKASKIRNALVHGNLEKIKKYQDDFFKTSIEIEDYLRRALRKLVEEEVIEETAKKQENK